jgi:hypothetical protein
MKLLNLFSAAAAAALISGAAYAQDTNTTAADRRPTRR